jgi:hypothetical protein
MILPNWRKSWEWENCKIKFPAQINNKALKIAWVNKWKKVNSIIPKDNLAIIKPNWLKVDNAIIFFISNSCIALNPAIIIVKEAEIDKNFIKRGIWDKIGQNRYNKKIPAVTKVDECTKAQLE